MFSPCLMAWHPDDSARQFAQDALAAIDAVMTRADAAARMQTTEPKLSEFGAGLRPGLALRLTALGEDFEDAFLARRAARRHGQYLSPSFVTLLYGASQLRRMAKVAPRVAQKRSA